MTEQETREKIINIIREFNVRKRRYSTYTEPNDDEELADALIAAGIGDVKRHRVFVSKDGKEVKQFYSGEEVENIVKERNELKVELRDKVDYIHEQDEVIKEYKHRAQVAERALLTACVNLVKDEKANVNNLNMELLVRVVYTNYLRKAKKELAEERKDD